MAFLYKTELKIFFTVWIVYIAFVSSFGGNYMAESMLYETMSIVDRGVLYTDDYIKEGCNITGCYHAKFNGHFYSGYAPRPSLMALPLYAVSKPFLDILVVESMGNYSPLRIKIIIFNLLSIIFISALLSALSSVLIYRIMGYFSVNKKNRLIMTFIFAFATFIFFNSTWYSPRIMSTFFALSAFYLLLKIKKEKRVNKRDLFLSGLLSSFCIALNYTEAIIFVLLFLYLITFLRDKRIIWFLFGAGIVIVGILLYHYVIFGDPLTTPYNHRAGNRQAYQEGYANEFTTPDINKLWHLSFSPFKGLFFYMPILLLSLYGLFYNLRKKKFFTENLLFLAILLVYLLFNSMLATMWHANCSFGPRFLIIVVPFLIFTLAMVMEKIIGLVLGFGILSFLINFMGVMYNDYVIWSGGCMDTNQIFNYYLPTLLRKGLSNYTLELINLKLLYLGSLLNNMAIILTLGILSLIIYYIWK